MAASLTAGGHMVLLAEGNVSSYSLAGKDLFVWAIGDVTGNYAASRDASVVTYGTFDAGLFAGRDIGSNDFGRHLPGVWARGDINGVIVAGRNIGRDPGIDPTHAYDDTWHYDIFAYGDIDATIVALNTAQTAKGGHIGSVAAWGDIDGELIAERSIDYVRSGGAVTGMLIAPDVHSPLEFDPYIRNQFELPETPESIREEVEADQAQAYQQLLADRAALDAAFVELAASNDLMLLESREELAETRAQITADNVDTIITALIDQSKDSAAAQQRFSDQREEVQELLKDRAAPIVDALAEARDSLEEFLAEQAEAFKELSKEAAGAPAVWAALDGGVFLIRKEALAASRLEIDAFIVIFNREWLAAGAIDLAWLDSAEEAYNTYVAPVLKTNPLFWPAHLSTSTMFDEIRRGSTVWYNTSDYGTASRIYITAGVVAADLTGVTNVSDAFSDRDAVYGQKQSTAERWIKGVFGSIQLVGTAFSISGALGKATGGAATAASRRGMALNVVKGSQTAPARFVRTLHFPTSSYPKSPGGSGL